MTGKSKLLITSVKPIIPKEEKVKQLMREALRLLGEINPFPARPDGRQNVRYNTEPYYHFSLGKVSVSSKTSLGHSKYNKKYPELYNVIRGIPSPDCTQYSIARSKSPRNFTVADKQVKKTFEIIAYFKPRIWFVENPQTGFLKSRPFMKSIPYYDVTYCMYGYPYKTPTRIWSNLLNFTPRYCNQNCIFL
jgi:hypothetical protein